jgi:hypothetical protein
MAPEGATARGLTVPVARTAGAWCWTNKRLIPDLFPGYNPARLDVS